MTEFEQRMASELQTLTDRWVPRLRRFVASVQAPPCCDSHNRNCEPPSELCCHDCTEKTHDMFPIRHADGSRCVMEDG